MHFLIDLEHLSKRGYDSAYDAMKAAIYYPHDSPKNHVFYFGTFDQLVAMRDNHPVEYLDRQTKYLKIVKGW